MEKQTIKNIIDNNKTSIKKFDLTAIKIKGCQRDYKVKTCESCNWFGNCSLYKK